MLVVQVLKPNWYIDFKVRGIEQVPVKYVPYVRTIGEEKYGTNSMCYVIFPLRRMEPPTFYRRDYLSAEGAWEGEGANSGNGGGVRGRNPRPLWDTGFAVVGRRRSVVWWCDREAGSMVSPLPRRRGGVRMVNVNQVVKLDIDVDTVFYDPQWLLEKKLEMLHSLGYQEEDAWWEYSPSGKHIHILIILKDPVPTKELFDLQFLLGDDHKRVYFNYLRYSVMGENAIHFNVLYAYKKSLTFSDKVKAILRHWFKSKQYSKKRKDGQTT